MRGNVIGSNISNGHRVLAAGGILFGGQFPLLSDTVASAIVAPAEMPAGTAIALIGGQSRSGCWFEIPEEKLAAAWPRGRNSPAKRGAEDNSTPFQSEPVLGTMAPAWGPIASF